MSQSISVFFFSPACLSFSSPSLNLSCFVLCLRSLPLLCGCSILSQRARPPPSHIGVEHKQAAAWIKHLTQNPLRRSGVLGWAMVLRHGALVTHGHTFFSVCVCVRQRERVSSEGYHICSSLCFIVMKVPEAAPLWQEKFLSALSLSMSLHPFYLRLILQYVVFFSFLCLFAYYFTPSHSFLIYYSTFLL